jgi:hypothetical protein
MIILAVAPPSLLTLAAGMLVVSLWAAWTNR